MTTPQRVATTLQSLQLALLLCAAVTQPSWAATPATAQAAATATASLSASAEVFAQTRQRLNRLNQSAATVQQSGYARAKALCWLNTAHTQYHENDRTGYVEQSLAQSMQIISALEANPQAQVGQDTPLVARSTRLREDLWQQLAQLKGQMSALACAADTIACAEVRLVRAGHAEQQTGWRQAVPHVQMVEDALGDARAQIVACQAQVPAQPVQQGASEPPKGAPTAPAAPELKASASEPPLVRQTLQTDTLFAFDKADVADLLPGGVQRLQALAERLKSAQSIDTIRVTGHTDRLGTDAYNDVLSERRAQTVRAYLMQLGVQARSFEAMGAGKRQPVSSGCSNSMPQQHLVACLQPDRRVVVDVVFTVPAAQAQGQAAPR